MLAVVSLNACIANAQSKPDSQASAAALLKAGRVLDVKTGRYVENAGILIDGDRIKEVGPVADVQKHAPKGASVIDLGSATALPGLIDCHTHLMARIPSGPDGYTVNLATKSQAFRALEGAAEASAELRLFNTALLACSKSGKRRTDLVLLRLLLGLGFCFMTDGLHATDQGSE
jgi:imidazolonepropionase-like amidohydrolase